MKAIFRRELVAYFTSPIVYVYLAVFTFFSGVFFQATCLYNRTTNMGGIYDNMFSVLLFIIPILTMRLLSEDKKHKTDQCLLTAPVSLTGIVLGKFFAATVVFCAGMLVFFIYALMLSVYAAVEWQLVICYTVGMAVLGMAFISVGLFISSLTESQIVSAIGSFACMIVIYMIDMLASFIPNQTIASMLSSLSFLTKFYEFTYGIVNISAILFFISFAAVMNFLTVKVLEKRRWG